ncbi:MAG: phosphoribosyltransferase family protein [Magnetospirillum sp.]|jgi:hypoxanthine phosphoribosyltransferase|nr:phosphoribosyltransferase family protein [Magnetospirillum sp.]
MALAPRETLHSAAEIADRVEALAGEIAVAIPAEFTIISILNGAFVFTADLMRALAKRNVHPRVEFVNLKSYGDATTSSGQVRVLGTLPENLRGQPVLLIDDILDSGRTLSFAKSLLEGLGGNPVKVAVFADKPTRRVIPLQADFVAFTIPDRFVVGYGLDHAQQWRGLPDLAAVD